MQQASGLKRFLAWIIDFTTLVPVYFLSAKIIEKLLKTFKHYPPIEPRGMFAYDKAAFETFFFNLVFILIFAVLVKAISYLKYNRTIGEKLLGLVRLGSDQSELNKSQRRKLVLSTVIKIVSITLPGPFVAFIYKFALKSLGYSSLGDRLFFFSLFLLIAANFFYFISPLIAYLRDDKASWVEKFTNTRVYQLRD